MQEQMQEEINKLKEEIKELSTRLFRLRLSYNQKVKALNLWVGKYVKKTKKETKKQNGPNQENS